MAIFDLLSELHTMKSDFRICAKVVRTWTNPTECFGDFLEIILGDEMGTMIQASVPNRLVVEILNVEIKEGDSYVIEKFNVSYAEKNPTLFDQKYHIFFSTQTVIRRVSDVTNNPFYNFWSFEDVLDDELIKNYPLVDLMGVVVRVGLEKTLKDENGERIEPYEDNKYMKFTIRDINGNDLHCLATGRYIEQVKRKLNKHKMFRSDKTFCVLRLWRVGDFKENVRVTSEEGVSDILEDVDDEGFEEFKRMAECTDVWHEEVTGHEDDCPFDISFVTKSFKI